MKLLLVFVIQISLSLDLSICFKPLIFEAIFLKNTEPELKLY